MDLKKDNESLFKNSALYQEFLAEREEILRHKWIESEKSGYDVGFEKALLDWIVNHRASWRRQRQSMLHQRGGNSGNGGFGSVSILATAASPIYLAHRLLQGLFC